MIPDSTETPKNLINEYGRLTVEYIEANIQNFIIHRSCKAQNSVQLFHCLTNSMTEAVHLNIVSKLDNYMDNETPVGEFLLKPMMQKSVINTRKTATLLI